MFETFSTSALEMIDKALRIAKSLGKNFTKERIKERIENIYYLLCIK